MVEQPEKEEVKQTGDPGEARQGEIVVVVMATPMPVPPPAAEGEVPSPENFVPRTPWEAWWSVFFDVPPPL